VNKVIAEIDVWRLRLMRVRAARRLQLRIIIGLSLRKPVSTSRVAHRVVMGSRTYCATACVYLVVTEARGPSASLLVTGYIGDAMGGFYFNKVAFAAFVIHELEYGRWSSRERHL